MTRLRIAALGLVVFLSACASNAPQDTFKPEGPIARTIQDLVNPVFIVAGVVLVLVEGGIVFLVIKFRRQKGDDEIPDQIHGNTRLEVGWTIVPFLMLVVVSILTVATILDISDQPDDAMTVEVWGQQWWWEYRYDIDGDGEHDDIITANELVIPAAAPVNLELGSNDVIHSWWAPRLNGKKDAVPGRIHPLTIESDAPGEFWGQCTEFCGLSHGLMRIRVIALDEADYDAWVQNQRRDATGPATTEAAAGLEIFRTQCSSCHLIRGANDDVYGGATQLTSGIAPDLTHLMSRDTFAGAIFDFYSTSSDYESGVVDYLDKGTFQPAELEAWLRDPPGQKFMAPDDARGMPNLNLTEEQIDLLVAYLSGLE